MRFILLLLPVLLLWSCKPEQPEPGDPANYATMSVWKEGVMGTIYNEATQTVAYSRPDANGVYHIFLSAPDGSNEVALTWSAWPSNRQQWAEEWSPDGQYLICYVEKTDYVSEPDHNRIPDDALPGYGGYTDIWLIRRDGSEAWQLTNLDNDYDKGVIHGAISADGSKFAWTERIQAPVPFDLNLGAGAYVFKVADISYGPGAQLSNVQTYQPNGELAGGEVESIAPDNSDILVYSSFESHNMVATPIYRIDLATWAATKLTEESFAQAPTYTPDGQKIVYMTGAYCDIFPGQLQGADWWIMDRDGANKRRLTYMNKKDHPQSVNAYRLAGSLSFINNNSFLGGVMTQSLGLTGYTALVSF